MEQEIILQNKMPLVEQEWKDALVLAMEEVGLNPKYIAKNLKNVLDNAVMESKTGNIMDDNMAKIAAMKLWHKFQKDTPDVQIQIANIFQTWENIL